MNCHSLLQRIFPTQGLNQVLLHCRQILYHLSHQGSPKYIHLHFSSVQLLSRVWLFATPWTTARQASQSITSSRSLLQLISSELVMPSNHLILCHPLLLPSIFPSIRVFSNESALCIRWPKYWSFSFISPSNEHSGALGSGDPHTCSHSLKAKASLGRIIIILLIMNYSELLQSNYAIYFWNSVLRYGFTGPWTRALPTVQEV